MPRPPGLPVSEGAVEMCRRGGRGHRPLNEGTKLIPRKHTERTEVCGRGERAAVIVTLE